jgi:hypothetical protein
MTTVTLGFRLFFILMQINLLRRGVRPFTFIVLILTKQVKKILKGDLSCLHLWEGDNCICYEQESKRGVSAYVRT